jgi:hypothetical protein
MWGLCLFNAQQLPGLNHQTAVHFHRLNFVVRVLSMYITTGLTADAGLLSMDRERNSLMTVVFQAKFPKVYSLMRRFLFPPVKR